MKLLSWLPSFFFLFASCSDSKDPFLSAQKEEAYQRQVLDSGACLTVTDGEITGSFDDSAYDFLMKNRGNIYCEKDKQHCINEKYKVERKFLEEKQSPYKDKNLQQRVEFVFDEVFFVFKKLRKTSDKTEQTDYKNFQNAHYLDKNLTPELVTCIAYSESREQVHPHTMNFTYCNKEMTSTAHGLFQTTLSTLRLMIEKDFINFNLPFSQQWKGKMPEEVHSGMSDNSKLQVKIGALILNSMLKYVRWKNEINIDDETIIEKALYKYYKEDKDYRDRILNKCLPCLKKSKLSPWDCYQQSF